MVNTRAKRRGKESEIAVPNAGPRWLVLPPEILRIILQYLAKDKKTLRACSRTAREFRHVALSLLGRHLTVNDVNRVKECARLITGGAFQHVRSLDLGTDYRPVILEEYWKNYTIILGSFARFHALNRLWLSEVPFSFLQPDQKKDFRETVTMLGSTVAELGLYGCHFSSYQEMISFIRSFPLCNFLFLRDCITGRESTDRNALVGLPEHKLTIQDLQLSASSSSDLLIDISNLIEDAALDIGSLTSLVCDVGTSERAQRIAAAVLASPVKQFQVACSEPEGFQAFMNHLSKWTLKSLTIGPQLRKTNTMFWVKALKDLPPLPRVGSVTVAHNYPRSAEFSPDFWRYMDTILSRRDLFPALKSLRVRLSCASYKRDSSLWWRIDDSFRSIRMRGIAPSRR